MPLNLPIETLFKQVSTRRLSGNAQVVRKYHLLLKNVQEVQNLRNTENFASESSYRIPEVQKLQLLKVVYNGRHIKVLCCQSCI